MSSRLGWAFEDGGSLLLFGTSGAAARAAMDADGAL